MLMVCAVISVLGFELTTWSLAQNLLISLSLQKKTVTSSS